MLSFPPSMSSAVAASLNSGLAAAVAALQSGGKVRCAPRRFARTARRELQERQLKLIWWRYCRLLLPELWLPLLLLLPLRRPSLPSLLVGRLCGRVLSTLWVWPSTPRAEHAWEECRKECRGACGITLAPGTLRLSRWPQSFRLLLPRQPGSRRTGSDSATSCDATVSQIL